MKAIGVAPYEVNYFNQHHLCLDDPLPPPRNIFKRVYEKIILFKENVYPIHVYKNRVSLPPPSGHFNFYSGFV